MHRTLLLIASVGLASVVALAGPPERGRRDPARFLESGTPVTIRAKKTKLSSVLGKIRKGSGIELSCVDKYGRRDPKPFARRVTFAFDRAPFWEVVRSIQEATSLHIKQALNILMAGRTTLIIAHRLSTLEGADRVVVMKKGELVETGDHNSLIATDSEYAQLFRQQIHL